MAVVQPMPRQVSAEWVRLIARHRCHITTHHPRLTIVRRPLRITVRQRHLTIALREEGAEVVDRMAAVRPVVVDHLTAGILLRVAVAATEDHDSSLKPLQFADRAGAAFFSVVRTRVGLVSSDFLALQLKKAGLERYQNVKAAASVCVEPSTRADLVRLVPAIRTFDRAGMPRSH